MLPPHRFIIFDWRRHWPASVVLALVTLAATASPVATTTAAPPAFSVAYGTHWRQALDVYLPPDQPGPFPVVVYIHGGGWLSGDRSAAQQYADDLLARGLAVAAINYRYSFHAPFPAQLHDCKAAIRWLRAHAAQHDLDPERFAAFGESSGGHLASLVALTANDPALEGDVGGNLGFSSGVQALVHGYGPTDLVALSLYSNQRGSEVSALIGHDIYDIIAHPEDEGYAPWVALVNAANPATHASADDPPSLLIHGELDDIVPASQSVTLTDALETAGAAPTLHLLPNVGHEIPESELPDLYGFLSDHLAAPLPISLIVAGAHDGDGFGSAIAVIGDVNGDGVKDFVVSSPFNDDRGKDAGRISVHSGANGTILRIIRGAAAGDRFGWSIAAAGDLNGDGKGDFIVGSPRSDIHGRDSGRVDVFTGGTWKRLRMFAGEHAGDQLGFSVAAVNVDGEGVAEIVAGAPLADQPAANCGHVLMWSATDGSLVRRFKGDGVGERLGWSIGSAGDVDGDGRDDLVIGAPRHAGGGANAGAVMVWGHDGTRWVRRFEHHGSSGDQLGCAVAGLGDADGDGLSDIAAGAPRSLVEGVRSGAALVLSPAKQSIIALHHPLDPQAGEQFGSAVAGAGDLDGDGLADVLIGAWGHGWIAQDSGCVRAQRGSGGLLRAFHGSCTASACFGKTLAAVDLDGDGVAELLIGAPEGLWLGESRGIAYVLHVNLSP